MKVNFKKIGVEVEADAESLIEKGINARENDWKEKLESKTKNKKEIIETTIWMMISIQNSEK